MSIRAKLIAITGVLAALTLAFVAVQAWSAWQARQGSLAAAAINVVADRLLESAGALAVERGTTNTMLRSLDAVTPAQRATIAEQRRTADDGFEQALARLAAEPRLLGRGTAVPEALVRRARDAHQRVAELRRRVDVALATGGLAPDDPLRAEWFPAVTALIMASQDIRAEVERSLKEAVNPQVLSGFAVRHALWEASEFAGRERGLIAGVLAAGKPLSAAELEAVAGHRGRVASAWAAVQARRADFGPEFGATLDRVAALYFDAFEQVRRQVYDDSAAGRPYRISGPEWFERATTGIARLLEAQKAAVAEIGRRIESDLAAAQATLMIDLAVLLAAVGIVAVAGWVVLYRIVRPIGRMTGAMGRLAKADYTVEIAGLDRADEIGRMARAVQVFKENAIENERLRAEQERLRLRTEAEKRDALRLMADRVEHETRSAVDAVAESTAHMTGNAENMADSADHVGLNAQSVAAAAEQALSNAQAVASAAEQLYASIREIGTQITHAGEVTRSAVDAGQQAENTIQSLSEAVGRIGEVARLIGGIAAQTNLLALNATIEAARAGEAGKGFVVVAGEVKNLANQTSRSTEEITRQIAEIRTVTEAAVAAVGAIGRTIQEMDEVSGAIAAAMEEQGAATQEITRNVIETTSAAREVSDRIARVSIEAATTGLRAVDVRTTAAEVAGSIDDLRHVLVRVVRTATRDVDRRRTLRYAVTLHGQIAAGAETWPATVCEMSEGGATVAGTPPLPPGTRATLRLDALPAAVPFVVNAVVKDRLHVRFALEPARAAEFRAAFARLVDTAGPAATSRE